MAEPNLIKSREYDEEIIRKAQPMVADKDYDATYIQDLVKVIEESENISDLPDSFFEDALKIPEDTEKGLKESIDQFTTNQLHGTGVFDRMMQAVELHIQDEYNKGRITGTTYGALYTQVIAQVLQSSVQFIGQLAQVENIKAQTRKINAETKAALLQAKIAYIQAKTAKAQLLETIAKVKSEQYNREYIKWKSVTEQSNTQKLVEINKNYTDGISHIRKPELDTMKEIVREEQYKDKDGNIKTQTIKDTVMTPAFVQSNIYGAQGAAQYLSGKQGWALERDAEMKFFKAVSPDIFNIVESAEGVGANKYGLNGSANLLVMNNLRNRLAFQELDLVSNSGNAVGNINKYIPDETLSDTYEPEDSDEEKED